MPNYSGNIQILFQVDWSSEEVMFSIKNGIVGEYKWFMLGFSRRGEFPRTDLCIFQQENDLMDIVVVGLKILFYFFMIKQQTFRFC